MVRDKYGVVYNLWETGQQMVRSYAKLWQQCAGTGNGFDYEKNWYCIPHKGYKCWYWNETFSQCRPSNNGFWRRLDEEEDETVEAVTANELEDGTVELVTANELE